MGSVCNAYNPFIFNDNIEFIEALPFIINLFVATIIGAL